MPRVNSDVGLINQHIRHTIHGVSCRHCGQGFTTASCEKTAREHVRKHINKGEILVQAEEENAVSDSDGSGEIPTLV